ncbi:MAG TPA: dihydroneopterin aldolase [Ignavibacteria bacterium]|nr:dihydroneopterin aldolase [Ignavibacteria bacterium]HRB01101.1 dihydroneopterin aldolase [Ignavibacteria bacterium]
MTKIRINNAKFFSYHGVLDYEKEYGNEFEVDIEMECELPDLSLSDDLSLTVNYLEVYNMVRVIFMENKYDLIETLNIQICKMILKNFPLVSSVEVKIRKPNAPLGIIDSVEIVNNLKRSV